MSTQANRFSLDNLKFDNRFVRELPADSETDNYRRQVYQACYSRVQPTPVGEPTLVAYSAELAAQLELSPEVCNSIAFRQIFVGNGLADGMDPYACCYGGASIRTLGRTVG
jgi:uncharacterized protein YdiU (UPF0061 family)